MKKKIVFFSHIPKCAGSSVGTLFDKLLRPGGNFFWHGLDGDVNKIVNHSPELFFDDCSPYVFVGGHFHLSTIKNALSHLNIPAQNVLLCTCLRNPSSQVRSYLNWIVFNSAKAGMPHPLYQNYNGFNGRISEALSIEEVRLELSNIQTRYVLGIADCWSFSPSSLAEIFCSLVSEENYLIADSAVLHLFVESIMEFLLIRKSLADAEHGAIPFVNVSPIDSRFGELDLGRFIAYDEIIYNSLVVSKMGGAAP